MSFARNVVCPRGESSTLARPRIPAPRGSECALPCIGRVCVRSSSPIREEATQRHAGRSVSGAFREDRFQRLDNASPRDAVCLIRAETLLCLWRGSIAADTETTRSICTPRPEFISRSHADWGAHSRVRYLNTQQLEAAARSERKIFRRSGERTQRRMDMDIRAHCAGRARALRILVWTIRNNQCICTPFASLVASRRNSNK
ncbi:hypothetical protein C2E23DRAFT_622195 [Lenzites betulinus]|nr:hypothetical protein C2E23DRAFT_622195 [Lenzites betulinus]